jgi:hypothetical protein
MPQIKKLAIQLNGYDSSINNLKAAELKIRQPSLNGQDNAEIIISFELAQVGIYHVCPSL